MHFPSPTGTSINMMPIVFGDINTIPKEVIPYVPMIDLCKFSTGDVVYLTVTESTVNAGESNRRLGIHTDATNQHGWGGGGWGGKAGIYLASNDGNCRVWEDDVTDNSVDRLGKLLLPPKGQARKLEANTMYHIGEYTPHESLPAIRAHYRQFFRLVGPEIGVWYAKHSTPSPFGVKPNAPIVETSKF